MTISLANACRRVAIVCITLGICGCATAPHLKALVAYETYDGSDERYPAINAAADGEAVFTMLQRMQNAEAQRLDNVTQSGWDRALDKYLARFSGNRADMAFIYVAAHGIRKNGLTYFIDARGNEVPAEPIFHKVMQKAPASIFFVDICRTPGQENASQPTGADLRGKDAILLFSTDAGRAARDGSGAGTRFAQMTIQELPKPQELRITIRNIVSEVIASPHLTPQNPWPYGLITFDVFPAGRPASGGGT